MNKFILSAIMFALMLSPMTAQAVNDSGNYERASVSVSATATKEVAPDTVEISFAVTTYDGKSMQKAAAQNKEISDKIYTALKSMINSANGDYVRTANYNATALYNYNSGKRNFDKYQVSNNVVVKTKSIDKVGAMIDKATTLGATEINNLNFSLSNYEAQSDELIAEAAKKAYAKASTLAKASASTIAGVKNLSVNSGNAVARVMYSNVMLKAAGAAMEDSAVSETETSPIEPGTINLRATVNASYYLK
ncbi:SIMPL domain-containing protein [bacterium]|nr:SIMPL domain-containing protein [bacterium]